SLRMDNDWGTGYCATVEVEGSTTWSVAIELGDSELNNLWNGDYSQNGSIVSVTGDNVSFGFCARVTGPNYEPRLVSSDGDQVSGSVSSGSGGTSTGGTTGSGDTSGGGGFS